MYCEKACFFWPVARTTPARATCTASLDDSAARRASSSEIARTCCAESGSESVARSAIASVPEIRRVNRMTWSVVVGKLTDECAREWCDAVS
jgi:hypothetical protein